MGVLEKRLRERLGVRHNHIQTKGTLDYDCISTGEAAAKRSLESCAVRTPRPTTIERGESMRPAPRREDASGTVESRASPAAAFGYVALRARSLGGHGVAEPGHGRHDVIRSGYGQETNRTRDAERGLFFRSAFVSCMTSFHFFGFALRRRGYGIIWLFHFNRGF